MEKCVSNGKYCPYVIYHEGDKNPANIGHTIIKERLRERCIYNLLSENNKGMWFDYMDAHNNNCIKNNSTEEAATTLDIVDRACSAQALLNTSLTED